MCRNEQIVGSDHCPEHLQGSTDLSIVPRCAVRKIQNLDVTEKSTQGRIILLLSRRHFDPEQEF